MEHFLHDIRHCTHCAAHLPHGCRPVLQAESGARLLIIGQAPGRKVHASGVPWDDASGDTLRSWLGVDKSVFYDASKIALMPMGFCYPGTGASGDLPPRPECAPLWHEKLLGQMPEIRLTLLIGQYSQQYYLKNEAKSTLTETVKAWQSFLPKYLPLPHPSPRNRIWMAKNKWFEAEVLPEMHTQIASLF